jgi:hypothetical protein
MTKLINIKVIQKNEIPDLLKPRFSCRNSSFQNLFCDGLVKIANYLKCNPAATHHDTKVIIYAFESQLIGFHEGGGRGVDESSELSSSILKFSRCLEKLSNLYHLKVHLICVKMLSSSNGEVMTTDDTPSLSLIHDENRLLHTIRLLLNPFKEKIIVEMMENRFLHYEYNFKDHIRENISSQVGELELPSIDDTRATLLIELMGTTLTANDAIRTIFSHQNRIQFTLLCTLPRCGLYPICTIGNPIIITPASNSVANSLRSSSPI